MKTTKISRMLETVARNGSARAIDELSRPAALITLSEAYNRHGRELVKRWIKEGLLGLTAQTAGKSHKMLDRSQLERVAARNNRSTYLPVWER